MIVGIVVVGVAFFLPTFLQYFMNEQDIIKL